MSTNNPERPENRSVCTLLTIIRWALVLVPAVILAIFLSAPYFLERAILKHMHNLEVEEPSLKVIALTPWNVVLSQVRGKNLGMDIDSIIVDFKLSGLVQGRVERITVSGLQWKIDWNENEVDWGLPSRGDTRGDNNKTSSMPAIPFKLLEIKSSSIKLEHAGLGWQIPVSGVIEVLDGHLLGAGIETRLLGTPVLIDGKIDPKSGTMNMTAQSSWPGHDFSKEQFLNLKTAFDIGWQSDAGVTGLGELEIAARLGRQEISAHALDIGLESGLLHVQAVIDDQPLFKQLELDLDLKGLRVQDYELSSLNLNLSELGSRIILDARTEGPAELEFGIQGAQTDLNDLLFEREAFHFDWSFHLDGTFSAETFEQFMAESVLLTSNVPASFSGGLQGMWNPRADPLEWKLDLQVDRADMGPGDFYLSEENVHIDQADFQGSLLIQAMPQKTLIKTDEGSRIKVSSIRMVAAEDEFELKDLEVNGSDRLIEVVLEDSGINIRTDARLGRISLDSKAARAGFEQGFITADLWMKENNLEGVLRLDLQQGELFVFEHTLGLNQVELSLPVVWGASDAQAGSWRIRELVYEDAALPGMDGTVLIHDYLLQVNGGWQFVPGADLDLRLNAALDDPGLKAELKAESGWFEVKSQDFIHLVPELEDFEVRGMARIGLEAKVMHGRLSPHIELDFNQLYVHNQDIDLNLRGASGRVVLDGLNPLQTPEDEEVFIHVQELEQGMFLFRDGLTRFRILGERIFVDKSSWKVMPEGRVDIYASHLIPELNNGRIDLYFEGVDLLRILSQSTDGRVEGSGLFQGHLSFGLDEEGFSIGEGYVYALPGTGRLGIRDDEWLDTLLLYVRESMAGHEYLSILSERLEQALRNFEYDFFSFNLFHEPGDVGARIEIRGQGVEGDPPQRVGSLVLNISGLEETLNRALEFRPEGEKEIRRALDDLFEF